MHRRQRSHGLTLIDVILVLAGVALVVAFIIPNSGPYVHRARPSTYEVKVNLKAMYVAEMAYFIDSGGQSDDAEKIGFGPERGNRYAYFLADHGTIIRRDTSQEVSSTGQILGIDEFKYGSPHMTPESWSATGCPLTQKRVDGAVATLGLNGPTTPAPKPLNEPSFLFAAAGNIDNDAELDCWSIASFDRIGADGTRIKAGEPFNDRSDAR